MVGGGGPGHFTVSTGTVSILDSRFPVPFPVPARGYGVGARGYGKLWVFDKLLLDHVGLPLLVILAVHLVIFCAGWV